MYLRKAKIVATIGPASSDENTIENLIKAGVNIFRLNFSHGTHEDHKKVYAIIRQVSQKLGKAIGILQDLQGPKLRVGSFENGRIELLKGEEVFLYYEKNAKQILQNKKYQSKKLIPYNYTQLTQEIKPNQRILLDDGNLEIVVTTIEQDIICAQVVYGGILKDKKGMNFPETKLSIQSFTEKDRTDLLFGLELGVDFVAMSFVRNADDVRTVQKIIHAHKLKTPVIAKIEKKEAIDNLKEILSVTNGVMVARGDLAVEVGIAKVPSLQKHIIHECRKLGIPVITATQILESMINSPRPTRAEASDIANAVLDGSDALMLSAETASGKFPVLAVSTMHSIILETENRARFEKQNSLNNEPNTELLPIVEAIESAASQMAKLCGAKAIVCTTHTGKAARALSSNRPQAPIFAFTDDEIIERQLTLNWGIQPYSIKDIKLEIESIIEYIELELLKRKIVTKGDIIVFTGGMPPLKYGTTNFLRVLKITKEIDKKDSTKKSTNNDELISYRTRKAQFLIDQKLCIQCGGCVEVCPNDIFGKQNNIVYLKESNCKNCTFDNACIEICPTQAIEIIKLSD
jgi:pyruvate kinase